jgi:D-lactate dehydrogenase (cytochrome)
MEQDAVLAHLSTIVGSDGVVPTAAADAYLVDERRLYRGSAALIVRPKTAAECAAVLRVCNDSGIGVVPQGGNTGYCGGATPFDGERQILLSTVRLNRVREVDTVGFTMTAEAGVVLASAQAEAASRGLLLPLSMGSETSAQIGGCLSTNAGGIAVLRYGTARDLVLGLEVVLPNGDVLSDLKGLRKDNTGYDLRSLFVGAEGTLGVITAAVLKLFPAPRTRQTAWIAVPDVRALGSILARVRRESGDQVVSAEYVARGALELVLRHVPGARDPFETAHGHYLLLELASAVADEQALRVQLERALESSAAAGELADAVLAESGAQRRALWLLRERVPEAERAAGGSVKHDISVRISAVPEFLRRAELALHSLAPCRVSVFGHVGDGNLHFNLLPPDGRRIDELEPAAVEAASAAVHGLAVELGGSFSAEHGIGVLKRDELARYKPPAAIELMRTLKRALDPRGIMNPGKVLPP